MTSSCSRITAKSSDAERCTFTVRIWPRSARSPLIPRGRGGGGERLVKALLAQAKKHKSVRYACSRAFRNFSPAWDSPWRSVKTCPTRFTKTAASARASKLRRSCHGARRVPKLRDASSAYQLAGEDRGMKLRGRPQNKICLPAGFSFSSASAEIKASGRPDLALVEACAGTSAAAVFTKNRVVAAPLEVGRAALASTRGRIRAVIVNSGNANCATGKAGISACQEICSGLARS